jgi:hypothetical protein
LPTFLFLASWCLPRNQNAKGFPEACWNRTSIYEVCRQWINVSVSNPLTMHRRLLACSSLDTSRQIIMYAYRSNITSRRYVRSLNNGSTGCPTTMPRGCWASFKSSYQHATTDSILRRWALVYLPTICVVSVFVALTWLGPATNNLTFRDKDLVAVITYFAALLVLECILLVHVAIRRQRAATPS